MINEEQSEEPSKIPFPDPLGILMEISGGRIYDPLMQALQIQIATDERILKEKTEGYETLDGEPPIDVEKVWVKKDRAIMGEVLTEVDEYVEHLKKAYRVAPCPGCRKLVESALVGAEVYREMEKTGKTVDEVKKDVEDIRKRVMEELHGG